MVEGVRGKDLGFGVRNEDLGSGLGFRVKGLCFRILDRRETRRAGG